MSAAELLLVVDGAAEGELLARALQRGGCTARIAAANDGGEAYERLTADGPLPRVVLLDWKLPRLTGAELIERVRATPRGAQVPLVVVAAGLSAADVARAYRAGANSCVDKPVGFDELTRALARVAAYWLEANLAPE